MTNINDSKDNTSGIRFDLQFFAEGDPAPEPGPESSNTMMTDPIPAPKPEPETTPEPAKVTDPNPNPNPEPKPDEKPVGAPGKYEAFKIPEGWKFDESVNGVFKELNLTQEQAQKLVDYDVKRQEQFKKVQQDNFSDVMNKWRGEIETTYGNKLPEETANVARFIDQIGGEKKAEIREWLDNSGAGNNPLLFGLFATAGKMLAEDKFIEGKPANSTKSAAEVLYGSK